MLVMGLGGMGVGEGVGSMHLTALQNMEVRGGEDYRYFFSPFLLSHGFDEKGVGEDCDIDPDRNHNRSKLR